MLITFLAATVASNPTTLQYILTLIGGGIAFIGGKDFLLPLIQKGWIKLMDKKNLDVEVSKDLIEVKDLGNKTYEHQLDFFNDRVQKLQLELAKITEEFYNLQKEYSNLTTAYYEEKAKSSKLSQYACEFYMECPNKKKLNIDNNQI